MAGMNNHAMRETEGAVRAASNPFLALARSTALLGWTIACYLTFLLRAALTRRRCRFRVSARWTHRWFKGCAAIMGIQVAADGPEPPTPVLLAPNHTTYADVVVVGAVMSCFFVSRADVAHWPGIGLLFRSTQHIGIERKDRRTLGGVVKTVGARLAEGGSVCVFLEGTTSDGVGELLPFRSSLAQAAVDAQVYAVPLAIRWSISQPGASVAEDVAYWREDHSFPPHIWRMLGLRGLRVRMRFGEPIAPAGHTRKTLASEIEQAVNELHAHLETVP